MQAYVRHKTVALGVPVKPTLYPAPEVQDILIHSLKQEEAPKARIIHDLSKDFFARRLESLQTTSRHRLMKIGR